MRCRVAVKLKLVGRLIEVTSVRSSQGSSRPPPAADRPPGAGSTVIDAAANLPNRGWRRSCLRQHP
jgi:hypothetical protein